MSLSRVISNFSFTRCPLHDHYTCFCVYGISVIIVFLLGKGKVKLGVEAILIVTYKEKNRPNHVLSVY